MRLVTYEGNGEAGVGVETPDGVVPVGYASMRELIEAGEAGLYAARGAAEQGEPVSEARIIAPIPRPGKILCCGVNYRSHQEENPAATLPTVPFFFAKLPSAVIGPGEPIVIPGPESKVDWEVELAFVIGRAARRVARADALDYVFGYTVLHDVSARDVQFVDNQITLGKGFDTFCPLGPALVTKDEVPDPQRLELATYVDDERVQSGSTADQLFDVRYLIEFLTRHITLEPGDVVSTGTPAGVGTFRQPPRYLRSGETVVVEVEGIGRLENPVVAGW